MAQESSKRGPRGPQDGPKSAQERPKSGPRGLQDALFEPPRGGPELRTPLFLSHGAQNGPKRPPRPPRRAPRGPRDPPKEPQEGPKSAPRGPQESPKMAPRDLREPLTTTPQLAWASFLDGLVGIREASRIDHMESRGVHVPFAHGLPLSPHELVCE